MYAWRNQSLARGLVPTTGSRKMYVKGENMDDEKEFYRSEIIRYVKKCDNTDWLYVTYYLLKKLLE